MSNKIAYIYTIQMLSIYVSPRNLSLNNSIS